MEPHLASEQMCWESKQKLILERIRVRVRVRHYLWLAGCLCFIYSQSAAGEPELMCGLEVELQSLAGLLVMAQSVVLWSAMYVYMYP